MSLEIFLVDYGENTRNEILLFNRNIFSFADPIWDKIGIKEALYSTSGEHASGIILPIESALCQMMSREAELIALVSNPYNNKIYSGALEFLRDLLRACKKYPNALIKSLN